MAAEIELFSFKGNDMILVGTADVFSGGFEPVDFLDPAARLLVFGGIKNVISILVGIYDLGPNERLEGRIYEDEQDNEGSEVDLGEGRISIQGSQEFSISLLREEGEEDVIEKEIFVYGSPDLVLV